LLLIVVAVTTGGTVALAAEPPSCADTRILSRVKEAYEASLMVRGSKHTYKQATLKDKGLGATPSGVNQYTPSKDFFNKSRYCETVIELSNGEKDQGWVRIDGRKDPNEKDYNFELCTVKFDPFKDGCEDEKKR